MRNRLIFPALAVLLLLLCSCSLAVPEGNTVQQGDRLTGFAVTAGHLDLFDFEGYFNDNASRLLNGGEISAEESQKYGGRVYAIRGEDGKIEFEGLETAGILRYFELDENGEATWICSSFGGISDVKYSTNVSDEGEESVLEGTLYACVKGDGVASFYLNPVYQTPEGEIYLTSGQGLSFNVLEGASPSASQHLSESSTVIDSEGKVKTDGLTVKANYRAISPPESIWLYQYGGDGELLAAERLDTESLPESIEPEETVQFVILETRTAGESAPIRELHGRDSETMTLLLPGEGTLCRSVVLELDWG